MNTLLIALVTLMAQAAAAGAVQASPEYVIGVQDVLKVIVHGDPDLSRESAVVDAAGTIECLHLGRVIVAGKTARQVEEDIKKRYIDRGILTRASITVSVTDFRSQTIHVTGEGVKEPGSYPMRGNETLVAAINHAGGFTSQAGAYIILVRKPKGDTNVQTATRVNDTRSEDQVKILKEDLDLARAPAIYLRDGDTIHVPKAEQFYVTGEVKNAGSFAWTPALTVIKAITSAGGKSERGGGVELYRTINGKQQKIDAKDYTPVLPGDVIKVKRRWV